MLCICTQEIHCEVNAWQTPILNSEIARTTCSTTQHNRVKLTQQSIGGIVTANVGICDEVDAFSRKQIDTTLNDRFVEFHVWNAVHEQTANAIRFLEHRYAVARCIKLIRTGQTCWTRSDD